MTGVQTCALPISELRGGATSHRPFGGAVGRNLEPRHELAGRVRQRLGGLFASPVVIPNRVVGSARSRSATTERQDNFMTTAVDTVRRAHTCRDLRLRGVASRLVKRLAATAHRTSGWLLCDRGCVLALAKLSKEPERWPIHIHSSDGFELDEPKKNYRCMRSATKYSTL